MNIEVHKVQSNTGKRGRTMSLDEAERAALIAAIVATAETIPQVINTDTSRFCALMDQQEAQLRQVDEDPAWRELIRTLLTHSSRRVRLKIAWHCGLQKFMVDEARSTMQDLETLQDDVGREARVWVTNYDRWQLEAEGKWRIPFAPLPTGISRRMALDLIKANFQQKRADALGALLKRAVRLWPVKYRKKAGASRLGGTAMLPKGMPWPAEDGEPFLFLGQINCSDVHAAVGETPLPKTGLLLFFGEREGVNGCGPPGAGLALHAPDLRALTKTNEDHPEPLVQCGLEFYETMELPHPMSDVIAALQLTKTEAETYRSLHARLQGCGDVSRGESHYPSKLLGWPDLIQEDVTFSNEPIAEELLLQMPSYHDGKTWQDWGDGGNIYVLLPAGAIAEARFDDAQILCRATENAWICV